PFLRFRKLAALLLGERLPGANHVTAGLLLLNFKRKRRARCRPTNKLCHLLLAAGSEVADFYGWWLDQHRRHERHDRAERAQQHPAARLLLDPQLWPKTFRSWFLPCPA